MIIREVRESFPVVKNYVYFNHAAHSPASKVVAEAIQKYIDSWEKEGTGKDVMAEKSFAKLIGAKDVEIARMPNTSEGLNIVANMLHYRKDSNVVINDMEYPSNVYPWLMQRSRGVKVRYVHNVDGKLLLEDVEKMVDDKTVAVAVSHVQWEKGFRCDLRGLSEIAHKHGAMLVVDAIQSAGALQIDVKREGIDFLACGCYKWLLGPSGAGFLYVRRDLINEFYPPFVGWVSVKMKSSQSFDLFRIALHKTARKFQAGSLSSLSFVGAEAALNLILRTGVERIEKRVLTLTSRLIEGLEDVGVKIQSPVEPEYRSGIVNFKVNNEQEVLSKLVKDKFIVSLRGGGIRVSPHFYNTIDEVDSFVSKLKSLIK